MLSVYFWNIGALKALLRERDLPSGHALRYLLAHALLWSGGTVLMTVDPLESNAWDLAGGIVSVVLLVPGLLLAFHQNGGGAGRDFLGRVLSLGWVVSIRVYIPAGLAGLAWLYVLSLSGPVPDETTWLGFLGWVAFEVLFYWRLAKHMGELRRKDRAA